MKAETVLASDAMEEAADGAFVAPLATAAPAGAEAARADSASDVALSLDQNSRLTAGEVDDNADWDDYLLYLREYAYALEMMAAAERGIKIYPIASSGLDTQGEYIFRQLAQYTGGRFIFLTYGAGGPGTTGTETDFQVSDYTVSALDALVVKVIEEELSYLVR